MYIPYIVTPSLGKTKAVAASSCKEIRDILSNDDDSRFFGINFDKHSPCEYLVSRVGYHGTFDSPTE